MHMIFIWLLAAAFASAGLFNAIATSTTRSNFGSMGYPAWWCRVTADWKYRPQFLVAIPATRAVGLVLCAVILAAAALTILRHREFSHLAPIGCFAAFAPDGESDFLKDRWLPGTWGSCRSAWNAEGERVPWASNRRIAPARRRTTSVFDPGCVETCRSYERRRICFFRCRCAAVLYAPHAL